MNEGVYGFEAVPFESEQCPSTNDHGITDLYCSPPVPLQHYRQGGRTILYAVLYCCVCVCVCLHVCEMSNVCVCAQVTVHMCMDVSF